MQIKVEIDTTGKKPDVFLALVYSWEDGGTRFTYGGDALSIVATIDGAKNLTTSEYEALQVFPYKLDFAEPPVARPPTT